MNDMLLSPKAIQLMGRIAHRLARQFHAHVSLSGTGGEALQRVLSASAGIEDSQLESMRDQLMQEMH